MEIIWKKRRDGSACRKEKSREIPAWTSVLEGGSSKQIHRDEEGRMGIDRGKNRGKARTVNVEYLRPLCSFRRIASCMSSLIQHSVTTVERENVYGGCQWHSTVIQDVALKMCTVDVSGTLQLCRMLR